MKTFDEWSSLGYKIIKGSKAMWVDGVAKFSEKQVMKNRKRTSLRSELDYDYIDEELGSGGPDVGYGVDWCM